MRQLKHRAENETRPVPISPLLGKILRRHLDRYGTAPDGRLFRGEDGWFVSESTVNRVWDLARRAVLSAREVVSVLAERPYDLRHARLSIWLSSGVDPAQVAEWAGNSVPVLLRVYVHCISDSQESALAKLGRKAPAAMPGPDLDELERLLLAEAVVAEPLAWFVFAVGYLEAKWPTIKHSTRRGAIEVLTKVTLVLADGRRGPSDDFLVSRALSSWAFNLDRRADTPKEVADLIDRVAARSASTAVLRDPDRVTAVMITLSRREDGEPAASSVVARRRSALFNVLEHAVAVGQLPVNPMLFRHWGA
ncbi:hypothetical protein LO762_00105 [Actinocorallia sp. API 0066]|uniref:hypothetical protein n=1 Tax=Actinocorallia sp. API 0066 TaxID=2896846 RepID=UPI001E33AD25|nr:hypothetical protein [Actinocorallia sp. API 0066]MCD0447606.1 hypothetical protein [Actinocorallia sp. API 0066]